MKAFRDAVERRDVEAMERLLAEDVVFRSPAVHRPYEGRAVTMVILQAVLRVFEDFHYTRVVGAEGDPDHVLMFAARVGDREVEGADFLHLDEAGLVGELTVMVRPHSALVALMEAMAAALPSGSDDSGPVR